MMHISPNKKAGFTIIETLVAITILMIAIAGPLTVAHKGLTAAVFSRNQMIASYLAQDAMEYVKNKRDSNLNAGLNWVDGLGSNCINPDYCKIDTITNEITPASGISLLYIGTALDSYGNTIHGYTHNSSSNSPTPFSRKIQLVPNSADEYKVKVVVSWKDGAIPNDVTLVSTIFNTFR